MSARIARSFDRHLLVVAILLASFVSGSYWLLVGGIPVLTEARDFIYFGGWIGQASLQEFFAFPQGANRRLLSMLAFGLQNELCGLNEDCLNGWQFLLMGMCVSVLLVHGHQLTKSYVVSAGAALLWAFSAPAASAAIWQATQHDKLALVTIVLVLIWGHRTLVKGPIGNQWLNGVLGVFLCSLAMNAKELAFVIPVAFGLQAALFLRRERGKDIKWAMRQFSIPLVYCAWFVAYYMFGLKAVWKAHVMGGDVMSSAVAYSAFLINSGNVMNLGNWAKWAEAIKYVVAIGLGAVAAVVIALVRREKIHGKEQGYGPVCDRHRDLVRVTVYLLGLLALTVGIVARATHPSAYYLLIPAWCFWTTFLILAWSLTRDPVRNIAVRLGLVAAVLTLSQLGFWANWRDGAAFKRTVDQGRRLSRSYQEIRSFVGNRPVESVRFVFPGIVDGYWYFFRGWGQPDMKPDQVVTSFMLRRHATFPIAYEFGNAPQGLKPGELRVFWTADLRLASLDLGEEPGKAGRQAIP
jgi:hypothetical protein